MLPIGHTDAINSVSYSPDGKYIVTSSFDNGIKLWESRTGQLLYSKEGYEYSYASACFSNDGKYILFSRLNTQAFANDYAKILETSTGKILHSFTGKILSAKFSPDGKYLVAVSLDKTVKVWESLTGKLLYPLEAYTQYFDINNIVSFSNDSKYIATISLFDTTVKVWESSSGKLIHSLKGHTKKILSVSFSPDGKCITSTSRDTSIMVWDSYTGKLLHSLEGYSANFSPDGKYIVTESYGSTVKVWENYSGKLLYTLERQSDWNIFSANKKCKFSPDGKYIVTA
ncbi:MAG: WD40 repeat domain-containing protein, partial [Bacteroidota bacterium]